MSQQGASSAGDTNAGSRKFRITFNQDYTSLQLCGYNGYRLFTIVRNENLEPIYSNSQQHTIFCERLFNSSLVAVVRLMEPRTLELRHYKKADNICKYSYSESILNTKCNRQRLVVLVEESIYIHNIKDMKLVHSIRDTPPNPTGLCALSIVEKNSLLAYPGSNVIGEVQIFDTVNLQSKCVITAHESPLAAMDFNDDATKMATASEKGTVIRVFNVSDGTKLYEFRRGMKRCVEISSLAFSKCSKFLGCASNTETVHIFKLEDPDEHSRSVAEAGGGGLFGYVSSFLPTQVTGVFNQDRAFCYTYLPASGHKNTICILKQDDELRLLVCAENGTLYIYTVNISTGGPMNLKSTIDLTTPIPDVEHIEEPQRTYTDSDTSREMAAAMESPPQGGLQLNDHREYPPLFPKKD